MNINYLSLPHRKMCYNINQNIHTYVRYEHAKKLNF